MERKKKSQESEGNSGCFQDPINIMGMTFFPDLELTEESMDAGACPYIE